MQTLVLPPLLTRWLIQYNPFFTASALCVLGGVFVLSQAMGSQADVGLTALLDAYQWLVVGAAAWLYARGQRRPAVMLAAILVFCMTDPPLQLAALAAVGAWWASALWVVSFALKLLALTRIFRLRTSWSALVLPVLGATVVASLPLLRVWGLSSPRTMGALLGGVVLTLGLLAHFLRPSVESIESLDGFPALVFRRAVRWTASLWVLAAGYHAWNSALAVGGQSLVPAVAAMILLLALIATQEQPMWIAVGVALLVGAGARYGFLAVGMASVVLWVAGKGRAPRVRTASLLAAYAVVHDLASGPHTLNVQDELVLAAAVTLPLLWWLRQHRAWSALLGLVAIYARIGSHLELGPLPVTSQQWGVLLVASGFLLLPAGVWVHAWLQRAATQAAPTGNPSTSVAIASHSPPA